MSEGKCVQQINEHNPFNINIEFNINSRKPIDTQQLKDKRISIDGPVSKINPCHCHPPRTPDPALTDRNIYNKQTDYLQPMQDLRQKRKSKRNSMDMNTMGKPSQPFSEIIPKSKQKVLMQTQLFKKIDNPKKKRSYSKYQGEAKRGLWDGASKSAAIEVRSGRKTHYNHSLKNIIHKIVNSQLSKRSLGTSYAKARSPYQLNSTVNAGNTTSRKRQKKKSLTCKSDRQIKCDSSSQQNQMVQKLNSLKSMTASILRSEIQEPVIPYYSKRKERIHIQTDNSIDFIEEIAFYEKKANRDDRRKERREVVNKGELENTNHLIETYIRLMEVDQEESQSIRQTDVRQIDDYPHEIILSDPTERQVEKIHDRKEIRDLLCMQMDNLLGMKGQESQEGPFSNKIIEKEEESGRNEVNGAEKIKPFLSSEIVRGGLSQQLQRIKFQQLKKQQIQKWGYLLEFIKKNMGTEQVDTQTVLSEVYRFLQRSKNDLQMDLIPDSTAKKHVSEKLDEQFTVKYSQNIQSNTNNKEYYQDHEAQFGQDEDIVSFKEEYATEENQEIKLLNLETISGALKQRKNNLVDKRDRELNGLELRREAGKISQGEYEKQREKILKWIKKELQEISKARKSISTGYRQARGILDKNIYSRQYEEQSTSGKMMKCLSETYLKKTHIDYNLFLKNKDNDRQKHNQSRSQSQSQQSESVYSSQKFSEENQFNKKSQDLQQMGYQDDFQDQNSDENIHPTPPLGGSQQLSMQKSQQMDAIKQRLLRMKHEHFTGEESSDNISYQQVQRELQQNYSDEEIVILNKELGTINKGFDNLETKLKYCCAEDKEDIFEFIFLDLCIELYQESCAGNRIMKAVNGFVTRAQAQAKKKKGVKTNLNVVKEYLKRFSSFLVRTNRGCLNTLSKPMGPSAIEMLKYMHDGDYQVKDEEEDQPTFIVPVQTFEKFQQSLLPTLQFEQYYDDADKEDARVNFLKTILHIHNRALFDSLNQFLDHERPYGIWGAPFPWKKAPNFSRAYSEDQLQKKLKKGTDKVIEQCSYVCGLLVQKQQSLVGNVKVSDAYVDQIREDRLSRMLANELVQSQQRWLFYDDEQTEVLVEMGSFVWNTLMEQLKVEVSGLIMK